MTRPLSGRPSTTPVPAATKTEIHASLDFTAFGGPWGQTVAANLTPDATTGIGDRYNEAQFIVAMRTGKKPNGTMMHAADAERGLPEHDRRRPQGDLRLPAYDQAG